MARRRPAKTQGPEVAAFFEQALTHKKGPMAGKPFIFELWQQEDIDLIYELDEYGRRVWRSVTWGIPRGNGKSPTAAGIGLLELVTRADSPEVFIGAGSRGQAGTVHGFAFDLPKDGPLADILDIPRGRTSAIQCPSNNGIMRVLSADGDLAHSLSVSVGIVDELHVFQTEKQEELYFALVTATQKRDQSVMLSITTAGKNKASLLGEKFDAMLATHELEYSDDGCRVVARNRDTGSLMIWRGAPVNCDVSDRKIWRACNPASWIPLSELERLAGEVPESVFRRLILNQWVLGADAAIQPGAWDGCKLVLPAGEDFIPNGADVWVGIDIGERRDTSAVNIICPMPDGRVRVKSTVFNPTKENLRTLLPLVEDEVRRIADTYQLRGCGFDPWQMRRSAELLTADGIRMLAVKQNDSTMVPISQQVFDMIGSATFAHDGDPTLRRHVLAAEAKQTTRGAWRFVKPLKSHGRRVDESQKVDALIALVIGAAAWASDETSGGDLWADSW